LKQETEKIVVLVRATPEESKKHGYLVCVAEINEKGEFRRVYPFGFSYGEKLINFKTKNRIEVVLTEPDNDQRRESRKQIRYKNLQFDLPSGFEEYLRVQPEPPVNNTVIFLKKISIYSPDE